MKDRHCVITGANTGIGRQTAQALARQGAKVTLACRNQDKTQPVIDAINSEAGEERAEFLALDLSDLAQVRESAAELLARDRPIHVLVNNAGLAGQRGTTSEGFELAFGVNHLGPFLFTNLLIERIIESAPARIVNVSSASHYSAKGIDWSKVEGKTRTTTGLDEYAVSKLANVLFSAELSRRLQGKGVTTYSLHPGVIASDVWRGLPWPVRPIAKLFMKNTEHGARTSVRCASAGELADESGLYYTDCQPKKESSWARDPELATELWNRSAEWSGLSA